MPLAWSRRQRRLALASLLAVAFAAVAGAIVFVALTRAPSRQPGEKAEGLTSELTRTLPSDYPRIAFVDATRSAGIDFQHFPGVRTSQLPEDMGSGVAWGDYNNDGWPDLFLVNSVGPLTLTPDEQRRSPAHCALYRNNKDGTFTDVSAEAGVDLRIWGMGVEWGDYDNDGWLDLAISSYGENFLLSNNGDGTFSDRSRASGIGDMRGFWSGVAWGDYDRDGYLDLYVTGYVKYTRPTQQQAAARYDVENPAGINPNAFPPERNLLYHNNRNGTFTEVAGAAGVIGDRGKSLEGAWADFDEDGWPDLYVANDVSDNQLFHNLRNGTFEDISDAAHVADYRSAMGLALGDWDGDGDLDLFITHWIAQENALYSNLKRQRQGNGVAQLQFADEADRVGLGQIALDYVGWGTFFFDYDNDGRPDLFVASGHTFQRKEAPQQLAPETNLLFWNGGVKRGFFEVGAASGAVFRVPNVARGAATADYDNDGDLDVVVVNHAGRAMLLRNDGGNRAHWLRISLEGKRSNRSAVGARIRIVAGGRSQMQEVGSQASYLSQNELSAHFGLGTSTRVDSVIVTWPRGAQQVFTGLASSQSLHVVEGESAVQFREATSEPAVPSEVPANSATSEVSTASPVSTPPAPSAVGEFWRVYREATTFRIAQRTADARDAYVHALALNPRHEDALYQLGNMSLELGDYARAESSWTRLLDVNRQSSRAHSRLGDLYACEARGAARDLRKAETEYQRAAELNREETGPLLRLGELALMRGDLSAATTSLNAVIGSHAGNVEARFLLAYVANKEGKVEIARARFRQAVQLARAAPPVQHLPGEGDTKKGSRPQLAQTARCRTFEEQVALLTKVDTLHLAEGMFDWYRQLDRRLARLAPRPAS